MISQNTASLAEAMEKLGFDASLQTSIATYISLDLPRFTIPYTTVKERDVVRFNFFFERKENAYSCLCYDAFLRKEIAVPDVIVSNIHVRDLDEQMSLVNWKELFNLAQNIESIIEDLKTLDLAREGKEYGDLLKIKYWSDTPLEEMMTLSPIKSKFEIGQRFYFFDGKGISVEEAYRFLNNKWMERQLKRKVNTSEVETKPAAKGKSKKSKSSKS